MQCHKFLTPISFTRNQIGLLIFQILTSEAQTMLFYAQFTQIVIQLLIWLGRIPDFEFYILH